MDIHCSGQFHLSFDGSWVFLLLDAGEELPIRNSELTKGERKCLATSVSSIIKMAQLIPLSLEIK
jgi:hypothetical protein